MGGRTAGPECCGQEGRLHDLLACCASPLGPLHVRLDAVHTLGDVRHRQGDELSRYLRGILPSKPETQPVQALSSLRAVSDPRYHDNDFP